MFSGVAGVCAGWGGPWVCDLSQPWSSPSTWNILLTSKEEKSRVAWDRPLYRHPSIFPPLLRHWAWLVALLVGCFFPVACIIVAIRGHHLDCTSNPPPLPTGLSKLIYNAEIRSPWMDGPSFSLSCLNAWLMPRAAAHCSLNPSSHQCLIGCLIA